MQRFNKRLFLVVVQATLVCTATKAQKLVADGNDEGTYQLIVNSGYNYETPDNSRDHAAAPFRHIRQTYDATLGQHVFAFCIHAQIDDDRGLANITDRQRNEIKTDSKSPRAMVGQEGEVMAFSWKFRLPEGMVTTSRFTHVHQLKGIDNEEGTAAVSSPLLTFTCYTLSSKREVLRIRYNDREDNTSTLAEADLSHFLGEWVEVTETVRFGAEGSLSVTITRMRDGKKLIAYSNDRLDMWRTGSTGLRPKWGIYRYIGENRSMTSQLRDETVWFADFAIEKQGDTAVTGPVFMASVTDTAHIYRANGTRSPDTTRKGLYIIGGRKYMIK